MSSSANANGSAANEAYTPRVILLTGGAGFIGSNVLLHLAATHPSYKLICLDKLDVCSSVNNVSSLFSRPQFVFVQGDICDAALVRDLCIQHDVDTIMNFAAQTHVDNSFGNSIHFTKDNVQGTHTLLECAKSLGGQIRRFIHVSTDEVYGEQSAEDDRSTEEAALNPTNPYAATKAAAEFIVKAYRTSFNLPTIITRGNNVYGPRQYPEKLIPKCINLFKRGASFPLHGSGHNRRSFLHVKDVASAFDCILHNGQLGNIYNIGSSEEYENIDVVNRVLALFRRSYPQYLQADVSDENYVTRVRDRAFNDFRYHIDSTSLIALGWKRQFTDLDQGIADTVKWYMDNPNHWPNVEQALAAHPFLQPTLTPAGKGDLSVSVARAAAAAPSVSQLQASPNPLSNPAPAAAASGPLKWLIFGHRGWIGGQVLQALTAVRPGDQVLLASARADDEKGVEAELLSLRPDRVVSLIGRTHGPGFSTIDYLEQKGKLVENMRDNLFAPMCLLALTAKHGIHFTYLGTGCIFTYDEKRPLGGAVEEGFNEESMPNFFGSGYSTVKGFTDRLCHLLGGNTLNVRIRMPITADDGPRNFITKITHYAKICSIANSMTVLPVLLPVMLRMAAAKETGTVNLTNPGVISHGEMLGMYRDIVDPTFKWQEFSVEEQNKILAAERSNNALATQRLRQFDPQVPDIRTAVEQVLHDMKKRRASEKA